jgi:hypothetical protein
MSHAPNTAIVRGRNLPAAVEHRDDSLPTDVMGEPCFYYWKPMIKAGEYHHPDPRYKDKKTGRQVVTFSRGELADADRYTREWIADGGKPYIPVGHKGVDKNLGWIIDTRYDGGTGTLWGLHQFIGEDAKRAAARNETSRPDVPQVPRRHHRQGLPRPDRTQRTHC